jgi:predicted CopG family antitoxin
MHKGDQKETKRGLKYVAVRPDTYDELLRLGTMQDSFDDVIRRLLVRER